MDWTAVGSGATAIAAIFAAVSARQSSLATRALETQLELTRKASEFHLLASSQDTYRAQSDEILATFGPWPGPNEAGIDPQQRKTVHGMLAALVSIYLAERNSLSNHSNLQFVAVAFGDWLQSPDAKEIWEKCFRDQKDVWPKGFVAYVDGLVAKPSLWESVQPKATKSNGPQP